MMKDEILLFIAVTLGSYFRGEARFSIRSKIGEEVVVNTKKVLLAFVDCYGKCTMDYLIEKGKEV